MDIVAASGIGLSYFELKVAFMFHEFARRGVDYAVVEVGMGGLLDGTNVVTRQDKVCIITDIGFDHTNVLGNTLAKIAAQKAGIIQPHNHAFTYKQSEEIMGAVRTAADRAQATLHEVTANDNNAAAGLHLPIFQRRNFYLARQVVEYILKRDGRRPLSAAQLRQGAAVRIPGRMETFHMNGKIIVLDGAHNEQKMAAFVQSVREAYPREPVAALVAFAKAGSNRWQPTADTLTQLARHIIVTSFDLRPDDRLKSSLEAQEVADYLKRSDFLSFSVEADLTRAYHKLLLRPERILLVTGSLYMLGGIWSLIGED